MSRHCPHATEYRDERRAAVQPAMERIILPELPHLVREARKEA